MFFGRKSKIIDEIEKVEKEYGEFQSIEGLIETLISELSISERKSVLNIFSKNELMERLNSEGRKLFLGNISECNYYGKAGILEVSGWGIPTMYYKEIEVEYENITYEVVIKKLPRQDIQKKYPWLQQLRTGWYILILLDNDINITGKKVCAKYKNGEEVQGVLERKISANMEDFGFEKILNFFKLRKDIRIFLEEKKEDIHSFYLQEYILKKLKKADNNRLMCLVKEIAKNFTDLKEKLVFYSICILAECFDAECMSDYVKTVSKLEKDTEQYWFLMEMERIRFYYPQYVYSDYYLERKEVIQHITESYFKEKNSTSSIEKSRFKKNRIAITVYGLSSSERASAILPMDMSINLLNNGYEVTIFVYDIWQYFKGECFVRPIAWFASDSTRYCIEDRKYMNFDVKIVYNSGESSKRRYDNFTWLIRDYNPDVILSFMDEYGIINKGLAQEYFVVNLPLSGYVASTECSIYISKNKETTIEHNQIHHCMDLDSVEEIPVGINYRRPKTNYRREKLSLSENKFIMVTVGNRLEYEINLAFAEKVFEILETSENFVWLLIGKYQRGIILEKGAEYIKNGQIKFIEYENDLPALYQICDVFANPDRMGGGTSIVWAMQQGVPVVTTGFYSDIMPILGIENTVRDYDEMKKQIMLLYEDREYYDRVSQNMIYKAGQATDKVYCERVLSVLQQKGILDVLK